MAAMLRDPVVVVAAVVRTRPRAIPIARITMGKSIHGFPFLSYMSMGLRLAALRAAGAPLLKFSLAVRHRGHKQRKLVDKFIHFFCLCPLDLTIKLNFNISKLTYCKLILDLE